MSAIARMPPKLGGSEFTAVYFPIAVIHEGPLLAHCECPHLASPEAGLSSARSASIPGEQCFAFTAIADPAVAAAPHAYRVWQLRPSSPTAQLWV